MSQLSRASRGSLLLSGLVAIGILAGGVGGAPSAPSKVAQHKPAPAPSGRLATQEAPPVQVLVAKLYPSPGRVLYRYTVINGSAFPITSVLVGFDYFRSLPELRFAPEGWDGSSAPQSSFYSPSGWNFSLIQTEDDSLVNIKWEIDSPDSEIVGGATLSGFSVTLTEEDPLYEQGHWVVYLDSGAQTYFAGSLQQDGTTAVPPSSIYGHGGVRVYPNPAHASVAISFDMPVAGHTRLEIFDATGRRVRELSRNGLGKGRQTILWDGRNGAGQRVVAGTYFVRINTPTTQRFARIMWMK